MRGCCRSPVGLQLLLFLVVVVTFCARRVTGLSHCTPWEIRSMPKVDYSQVSWLLIVPLLSPCATGTATWSLCLVCLRLSFFVCLSLTQGLSVSLSHPLSLPSNKHADAYENKRVETLLSSQKKKTCMGGCVRVCD